MSRVADTWHVSTATILFVLLSLLLSLSFTSMQLIINQPISTLSSSSSIAPIVQLFNHPSNISNPQLITSITASAANSQHQASNVSVTLTNVTTDSVMQTSAAQQISSSADLNQRVDVVMDSDQIRNYITHEKTLVMLEFRRATPSYSEPRPLNWDNQNAYAVTSNNDQTSDHPNIGGGINDQHDHELPNESDNEYELANNSLGPMYAIARARSRELPFSERSMNGASTSVTPSIITEQAAKVASNNRRNRNSRRVFQLRVRRHSRAHSFPSINGNSTTTTTTTNTPVIMSSSRRSSNSFMRLINGQEYVLIACDMWDLDKRPTLMGGTRAPRADGPPPLERATRVDFYTIEDAIVECRQLAERESQLAASVHNNEHPDESENLLDVSRVLTTIRGVLPGTKWCGLGDLASSYSDLGERKSIDICCRAHDHCSMRLKPLKKGYGLHNIALYTKSNCVCDADFYQCLKGTNTTLADVLGQVYFNIIRLQCIKEHRVKVCKQYKPIALGFEKCAVWSDEPRKISYKFIYPPVAY